MAFNGKWKHSEILITLLSIRTKTDINTRLRLRCCIPFSPTFMADESNSSMIVAIVAILVIIAIAFIAFQMFSHNTGTSTSSGTDINITVPSSTAGGASSY